MRVGVAVAVVVARVVDGDAVDGELEVLPLVRVEAAQEDLLGVARAALVREEEARGELERVGGVRARDGLELAERHVVVGGAQVRGARCDRGRRPPRRPRPLRSSRARRSCAPGAGGAARARPAAPPAARAAAFGFDVSTTSGGGAGGAKWKGTLMRLATGLPSRVAGVNVHWRAATTAASSRSAAPDDCATSTFETCPSASTVTVRTTSACFACRQRRGRVHRVDVMRRPSAASPLPPAVAARTRVEQNNAPPPTVTSDAPQKASARPTSRREWRWHIRNPQLRCN